MMVREALELSKSCFFFEQGYDFNQNASVWLGNVHAWLYPLDRASYPESAAPIEIFCGYTALVI